MHTQFGTRMDVLGDTAAILNSIVSNAIMGCSGDKYILTLPPGHPTEFKMATITPKRPISTLPKGTSIQWVIKR